MTMKKMFWVFLAMFLVTLSPAGVQAHPPKTVDATYNFETQTLTVTIEHWAMSTSIHFIETVTIRKKGKVVEKVTYKSQPETEEFSYTYKVPAEDGEKLEVTAVCSVHGSGKANVTAKKPKENK
jgi:desulfoferrodoxin (superoxide reductase-like protein)